MANRLPEEQEEKGFRDGRPQELPKCLKRTSRAARHSGPRTASGKFFALRRHGPLAVAAGCALVLASTAGPVHALRFDQYPGCDDLCSEAFWYGAAANDVTAALAGEPASMSYLGHVLRLAVSSGANADAVAVLLRAGAPPNARHDSGERRYVLHDAVLLSTGAPSDRRGDDDDGDRRVREGAAQRSARVVSALLAAGADPRAADASGLTAIDLARRHGNADALALLQSRSDPPPCGRLCTADFWKSADPEQVRAALTQAGAARGWSPRGDTPLHLALEMAADAESVTILLDGGADPNARNARDDTPLHMAAGTAGNAAAIAILLARGAMLGAANAEDRTPLHVASEHPATIENMRALLDGGADPDIRTGELSGLTPWELAARQPEGPQAMALLLEYGDRSDVVSGSGFEPLLHHAAVGHPDTVTLLLDRGAQAHQRDRFGRSALFKAAAAGNAATVRVLLRRDADPNWSKYDGPAVLSGEGERPLHVAVHFPEVLNLLLEHGADPDGRMPFTGTTPLHLAAGNCEVASLALLLARGADPNARDEHGDTPLTHAVRRVADAGTGTDEWETWRKSCETDTSWEDPERCIVANRREYVRKYEPREECEGLVSTLMRHGARTDIPGYDGHPPLAQAWLMGLEDAALRWYREGVERGADDAQFNLGLMYARGEGVARDHAEAARLLRLAAEQGHPGARYALGLMYIDGTGVAQDDTEGLRWIRLAAEQGLLVAYDKIRQMTAGIDPEDEPRVVRWSRLRAEQGDPDAQYDIGVMYAQGDFVPENDAEAMRWLHLAAEQGHARAQYYLASMYGQRAGEPEDDAEAARLMRLAAQQGYSIAQGALGIMYANGTGVPQDDNEALHWIRLAAEQRLQHGRKQPPRYNDEDIGPAYETGASRFTRLAAENGDAEAQYIAGIMYEVGFEVRGNGTEAARWYRLSAEQGHAGAQASLGHMYYRGWGVSEDGPESVRWNRLAAEQDHADAQNLLGLLYSEGKGVAEDDTEAARWFRRAARLGNAYAQYNLGYVYAYGEGVPEDPVEAFAWFSAAAQQGVPGAEEEKEFVAGRMDRDQALRAGKLSRTYWARYVAPLMH